MFGKLAGAFIGEKIAGRNRGLRSALVGAGWAAKKVWDKKQGRSPTYPSEASPD